MTPGHAKRSPTYPPALLLLLSSKARLGLLQRLELHQHTILRPTCVRTRARARASAHASAHAGLSYAACRFERGDPLSCGGCRGGCRGGGGGDGGGRCRPLARSWGAMRAAAIFKVTVTVSVVVVIAFVIVIVAATAASCSATEAPESTPALASGARRPAKLVVGVDETGAEPDDTLLLFAAPPRSR